MATLAQVTANRENGLKGGVKTEEGKAVSRLNAQQHGIFSSGVTAEDAESLHAIEERLIATVQPVGRVEEMLVEKLALTYLRMQRCARAEAEYHIETWEEPNKKLNTYQWELLQRQRRYGARGSCFRQAVFERMVRLVDLYDSRLTNQFLKILHEIERQQRLRAGEDVPPPVVGDLTIQADAGHGLEPARDLPSPAPEPAVEPPQDVAVQADSAQKAI